MRTATSYLALLVALVIMGPVALAQDTEEAPELGDEFIFFIDAANIAIPQPESDYVVEPDPTDPESGNLVARMLDGRFAERGFSFDPAAVGVDAGQNQADGDTLYVRFWSGPLNAGRGGAVRFQFKDSSDESAEDPADRDYGFRLHWIIPEEFHDGEWHEVAIQLPPATYRALEDAKANDELSELEEGWFYGGAWSSSLAEPIGLDGDGPDTADNPQLWSEFDWENVFLWGVTWDQDVGEDGRDPIYIDYMYVADQPLDLSAFSAPPDAYAGTLTPTTTGSLLEIGIGEQEDVGGYRTYFGSAPITDITDTTSVIPGSRPISADADMPSFSYRAKQPHPNLPDALTVHYGVTTVNNFGLENPTAQSASISVPGEPKPFVYEIAATNADALIDQIAQGNVDPSAMGIDTNDPFVVGNNGGQFLGAEPEDDDLDTRVWMAYAEDSENADNTLFFIYADVTDDTIVTIGDADGDGRRDGCCPETYDNVNVFFGAYPIDNVVVGSPYLNVFYGDTPTYGIRLSPTDDRSEGRPITGVDLRHGTGGTAQGQLLGSIAAPAIETKADGSGYRILAVVSADELPRTEENQGPEPDAMFTRPPSDEVTLYPLMVAYEDQDGSPFTNGNRTAFTNSDRPDLDISGPWFGTPQQWPATAFQGLNVVVSNEDAPLANAFELGQNYPNPFTGATTLAFSLAREAEVTLAVYNVLGQRVAVLADRDAYPPGAHLVEFDASGLASGIYLYKLEAGDFSTSKQMLVVR